MKNTSHSPAPQIASIFGSNWALRRIGFALSLLILVPAVFSNAALAAQKPTTLKWLEGSIQMTTGKTKPRVNEGQPVTVKLLLQEKKTGKPLVGKEVNIVLERNLNSQHSLPATTDKNGIATFKFSIRDSFVPGTSATATRIYAVNARFAGDGEYASTGLANEPGRGSADYAAIVINSNLTR